MSWEDSPHLLFFSEWVPFGLYFKYGVRTSRGSGLVILKLNNCLLSSWNLNFPLLHFMLSMDCAYPWLNKINNFTWSNTVFGLWERRSGNIFWYVVCLRNRVRQDREHKLLRECCQKFEFQALFFSNSIYKYYIEDVRNLQGIEIRFQNGKKKENSLYFIWDNHIFYTDLLKEIAGETV